MAEQGIASFCFDFCGGSVEATSSMDTTEMTITTECEDLRAVVEWVSKHEEVDETRLFLFGASMGGLVSALTTEQLQERIRGLVLLFPALCVADDWTKRYGKLEDVPETVDLWGMTIGRRFVEEVYGMDVFSKLGSYQGEVLFFHGGYDSIVPISYSETGSQLYAKSELTVYKEEGHGFSEESNQLVRERVVDFILHKK